MNVSDCLKIRIGFFMEQKNPNEFDCHSILSLSYQVTEVEEEMRELLRETALSKKAMEERVKKLTRAFSELQDDLL